MSKTVIIVVAAVLVLGGGAAAYVLTRPNDTQNNNQATTQDHSEHNESDHSEPKDGQGTIEEFMAAGENKKCTYADSDSNGTMYFASNERLRMDYSRTGETKYSGSMIVKDGKQYIWDNTKKEGFTFAFDTSKDKSDQQRVGATQTVDVKKRYDFDCESWTVDESMFTPPSDVKFQDFSSLMNQIPTN